MSLDEEGYVYRRRFTLEKVKLPADSVKCPVCHGSGERRIYYGPAGDRGQFGDCFWCHATGFLKKEELAELKKSGLFQLERRGG